MTDRQQWQILWSKIKRKKKIYNNNDNFRMDWCEWNKQHANLFICTYKMMESRRRTRRRRNREMSECTWEELNTCLPLFIYFFRTWDSLWRKSEIPLCISVSLVCVGAVVVCDIAISLPPNQTSLIRADQSKFITTNILPITLIFNFFSTLSRYPQLYTYLYTHTAP